jgi:hypothetical protein
MNCMDAWNSAKSSAVFGSGGGLAGKPKSEQTRSSRQYFGTIRTQARSPNRAFAAVNVGFSGAGVV